MQLYATELIGSETYDDQGHFVGRVREFFIEPADQPKRRLVVRGDRGDEPADALLLRPPE
jgi:sporulation protein YlmC with PRC-barrel domain